MAHQSLTFTHPTSPRQSPIANVIVQHRERWADSWVTLDDVRFDGCVWALAPSTPRAQISQRYGEGKQPTDLSFGVVAPLDLTRHFLRIELQYEASGGGLIKGAVWHGQVEISADEQEGAVGNSIQMGEQAIVALGLYNLLDQHRIAKSIWKVPSGSQVHSDAGFVFNLDGHGNRLNTKPAGQDWYPFAYNKDPSDPVGGTGAPTWSTRDIIEYLIRSKVGIPTDETGAASMIFEVDDTDLAYLPAWDAPEVETHLVSTTQIFNSLISRRRLLTWWLEVDEVTDKVKVRIKTMTHTGITLPSGETIVPNLDSVDLNWSDSATTSVIVQADTSHKVDQVIAYGARMTNTLTTTFGAAGTDQFEPGWDSAQELAYETAGNAHGDYPAATEIAERRQWHARFRAREEVKPVYRRWVLRDTIDYPKDDPDNYLMFYENVQLLTTLPFLAGVDHTQSTLTFPGNGQLERRQPFVVIQIPGSSPARYIKLNEIGRAGQTESTDEADIRDWSATIRFPKDGKTITIDVVGAEQHTIAYADFTPLTEDEQDHGEWDWNTMLATVTIADERYAEGKYPADIDVDPTDAKRIIRIPAGDNYRVDWVSDDTTMDLDANGALLTRLSGYYFNDHRDILNDVAAQAYEGWYGITRNSLRVRTTWDDPCHLLQLGEFVTNVTHKDLNDTPVNAVISELEVQAYHFTGDDPRLEMPTMKLRLYTAHGELDWAHLKANR